MRLIYLAGPYTHPDPSENTNWAIRTANMLWDAGFLVYVPHLTHLWHVVSPKPHDEWLTMGKEMVRRCDAVFRLTGESKGADEEVALAKELGIPVFTTFTELRKWADGKDLD